MHSIAALRLSNQQIVNPTFQTPGEVVSWLGALQGQDYPGTKWAVGLRLPNSTEAQIEKAIADKSIVRTWMMRGTLHFVAPADVLWIVELVGQQLIKAGARRYRELELDDETLKRSDAILANALTGGKTLTRSDLFVILEKNGISTAGQRGYHMLSHAALNGLTVQTTADRSNPMFLLLDELSPAPKRMARDEALAELARRYFTSRGPALLGDFAGWTGLPMADVRAALEAVKPLLICETIDGQDYWFAPNSAPESSQNVHLLPGFDEYLLGYKNRDAVLDPQYAELVCPGKNGIFQPTIVIDGRVVGLWKRTVKKRSVEIALAPFTRFTDAEVEAITVTAERYGEFLGLPVVMR